MIKALSETRLPQYFLEVNFVLVSCDHQFTTWVGMVAQQNLGSSNPLIILFSITCLKIYHFPISTCQKHKQVEWGKWGDA